jgi:hypothetical protein
MACLGVLAIPQLSLMRAKVRSKETPDLGLLQDVVAEKVIQAMRVASEQLTRIGVRHVLVGGLAVGAHGHPRATKDVDFLVSEDAFEHHAGGVVTMKAGMPIQVDGVMVDFLSAKTMNVPLDAETRESRVPIAPISVLVHLKLLSPRRKDAADVVELVKVGIDTGVVRAYLEARAPELLGKWEESVAAAVAEED